MAKILVTGGAVHAHLDAVKITTNNFKGGRMSILADMLYSRGHVVTYLDAKGIETPGNWRTGRPQGDPVLLKHTGFHDYMNQVLTLAPSQDAVILGAAVCNLIPSQPWKDKFPLHNYKVGDRIDIPFQIAPRVIDQVKKVAPNTHLFGFKLLSGVPHEELIEAAYDIVLESRATAVFANDLNDLDTKFAVTKERGVHKLNTNTLPGFIDQMIRDEYYSTTTLGGYLTEERLIDKYRVALNRLVARHFDKFQQTYGKKRYVLGTIAYRLPEHHGSFITTARGKTELEDWCVVTRVDHSLRRVVTMGNKKATLNAPLLHTIFEQRPAISVIIHYHQEPENIFKELPYAPPGTARDSQRNIRGLGDAFYIKSHGTFELYREVQ